MRSSQSSGQGFLVFGFFAVQFGTFTQYLLDAFHLRAVRVVFGLALGVVFAVDRGPLEGILAGAQPQPQAKEVLQGRVQVQGTVGGVAVQVDRDADNGHVGHGEGHQDQLSEAQAQQAVLNEIKHGVAQ